MTGSTPKKGIALNLWQQNYKKEGNPSTAEEMQQYGAILSKVTADDAKGYIKANSAEAKAGVKAGVEKEVKAGYDKNAELNAGKPALIGAVSLIYNGNDEQQGLKTVNALVNGDESQIKNALLPGLKKFNAAATEDAVNELAGGQDSVAGGVSTISSAVLGNKTLRDGVKKNLGTEALTLLKAYKNSTNPLSTKISDFAKFEAQMDKTPDIVTALTKAKALLNKTKAKGVKTLKAGKKKLASGKAQYAKGLSDYKAAPGKLAAGRAALADGLQKLMDGRADLAAGKDKLAEYEDGEQQVRDGLATLMGTEANGGLTSILDRRNGDDEFDDPNGHLQLDEGLEAVDVGRGYQADSGELITKEITNRAIGTAAGLGAGALAVLAALLSFLKKNKASGVSALLSAAAGGAGIAAGTSAGMEFSNIAGSAVGSTPWIAFGVLAAVALVHAITHFASKEA